jgi:uncharacterized repeat protein (TIGR01451 family)
LDADGVQDGSEPGLANVTVTLYDAASNMMASAVTTGSGAYSFASLLPGVYFLDFGPLPGYVQTLRNQGGDDGTDSDPDPLTGRTTPITLISGQNDTTADAGYRVPSSIRIDKTPDYQMVVSGSNATFRISVTNDGPTTLTNVVVADPQGVACGRALGTMLPGSSTSYLCTVVGVTASFTNVATVTGFDLFGNVATSTNDAVVRVINPAIRIFKDPGIQQIALGASAVFTITVTNVGDVALTNVVVSDPVAPQCDRTSIGTLQPGAGVTYSCTVPTVTTSFVNSAAVVGYDPLGSPHTDRDTADVAIVQTNDPGCTRSPAFWKAFPNAWPVPTVMVGGVIYNSSNASPLLCNCATNDWSSLVAKRLITAKLNAYNGADTRAIAATMAAADEFLIQYPVGSNPRGAAQTLAQSLALTLRDWNCGVTGPGSCTPLPLDDFDGDTVSDIAVYWPGQSMWYALLSGNLSTYQRQWGYPGVVPVVGDYDGDVYSDVAVFDPASATWYVLKSTINQLYHLQWGFRGVVPVQADYDGDGHVDIAVFDPATATWYILQSGSGQIRVRQWGYAGVVPVPADYDGDGFVDIAVMDPVSFRWYILQSGTDTLRHAQWGFAGVVPVPADYDGDNEADVAVYHVRTAQWYIFGSDGWRIRTQQFGWNETVPVPGDYDGDLLHDIAVYHRATGTWYVYMSSTREVKRQQFGWSQAYPVLPQYQINRHYRLLP